MPFASLSALQDAPLLCQDQDWQPYSTHHSSLVDLWQPSLRVMALSLQVQGQPVQHRISIVQ